MYTLIVGEKKCFMDVDVIVMIKDGAFVASI
jgi:hypothetical protein